MPRPTRVLSPADWARYIRGDRWCVVHRVLEGRGSACRERLARAVRAQRERTLLRLLAER